MHARICLLLKVHVEKSNKLCNVYLVLLRMKMGVYGHKIWDLNVIFTHMFFHMCYISNDSKICPTCAHDVFFACFQYWGSEWQMNDEPAFLLQENQTRSFFRSATSWYTISELCILYLRGNSQNENLSYIT